MPWGKPAKGCLVTRIFKNKGAKTFIRRPSKPRLLKPRPPKRKK